MCSSADLSDKAKYPTFARTFVVDSQVGPSVISLLKYTYNWTRVAIIYQDSTQWKSLKEHLVKEFEKNGIDVANEYMVVREAFYFFLEQEAEFRAALRKIKEKARSKYMWQCSQSVHVYREFLQSDQIKISMIIIMWLSRSEATCSLARTPKSLKHSNAHQVTVKSIVNVY